MKRMVIYRGPSDRLVVGSKVLKRDGEPVELGRSELERVGRLQGHKLEMVDRSGPEKGDDA